MHFCFKVQPRVCGLYSLSLSTNSQSSLPFPRANIILVMLSKFKTFVEGFFLPIVSTLGFTGNFITIRVLSYSQVDLKPVFRSTMTMLAVFDSTFLPLFGLTFSLPLLFSYYEQQVLPFLLPFSLPALQASIDIPKDQETDIHFSTDLIRGLVKIQINLNIE